MITKFALADELAASMNQELVPIEKKIASKDLVKAVNYLQAAAEIFEEVGLVKKSDQVLGVLSKLSNSETELNMVDDNLADDLLNIDINDADLEVLEKDILSEMDFEDEI